jgi:Fe-S-cluster containining protein
MKHSSSDKQQYFFNTGIKFECTECGYCCTGEEGTIYVTNGEIEAISGYLQLTKEKVTDKYLYPFRDSYSIKEEPNGDCIFYKDKKCEIYSVRPAQCRTYPFWVKNLRTEEGWKEVMEECPGVGRGRLYTKDDVLDILQASPL